MASPSVHRQRPRLDVDARQPSLLRAEERLGPLQVVVDVGRGAEQDLPQQKGHVARKMVVDGRGRQADDLGRLLECPEDVDDGTGGVLTEAASGNVVVGGDDHEHGPAIADAGGEELLVLDGPLDDLDPPASFDSGQKLCEFGLVAAVGVDLRFRLLQESLYECGAAVTGGAQDCIGGHCGR